jgi:hypothetical protein
MTASLREHRNTFQQADKENHRLVNQSSAETNLTIYFTTRRKVSCPASFQNLAQVRTAIQAAIIGTT